MAGVTVSRAIMELGGTVELFEKKEILSLFSLATHRWLHPGLFNWPQDNWAEKSTKMPFLNWDFSVASEVTKKIRDEFQDYVVSKNKNNGVRIFHQYNDEVKLYENDSYSRPCVKNDAGRLWSFDHLIIAVGFGEEKAIQNSRSYWTPDALDSSEGDFTIVGSGDGGLIDGLRVRLNRFDERVIVDDFMSSWDENEKSKIERQILDFEKDLKQRRDSAEITEWYSRLDAPSANIWFKKKLRNDTNLTIVSAESSVLTNASSPINRFLFSRLLCVDTNNTKFKQGTMNFGDRDKVGWIIRFAEGGVLDSSHESGKIILRIGPKGCLQRFSETIHNSAMNTVRSLGEIDLHRFFYWDSTPNSASVWGNTDEENKIVSDVTELFNWIQSYRAPLFDFVFKELIKTNLTRMDVHKHISTSFNTSKTVKKWIGNQQLSFDERLNEDVYFIRGFCSNHEEIAALDREWTVCCPAFLIAPAVCF